ncbi:hypothetical protein INT44_006019 [Umbelopsis vinacea]|uniref:Uncharacterized protein n=1 Tax=Umbelopsis vinacea TaxID=44442 RepID=A0A8H7UKE4_9FUNG|nr:hypothetical protein INT44_006019 [Umbelopsis vinacea]
MDQTHSSEKASALAADDPKTLQTDLLAVEFEEKVTIDDPEKYDSGTFEPTAAASSDELVSIDNDSEDGDMPEPPSNITESPKQELQTNMLSTPIGSPSFNLPRTPDDDAIKNDQEFEHIITQFDETAHNDGTHAQNTEALPGRRRSSADAPQHRRPSARSEEISTDIPFDFNRFLEQMKRRGAIPITKYFKSFLQAFDRRPWTVNEQIKIIQDFLDFIYGKMQECDVWRDTSDQEFENAKEGMEKLVMNRLFHLTFSPNTTDDKERDEILYHKIRIFSWITEEHLDIPVTQHNESFLTFAESELLKINNYKAPRDKLICILNCCKVIFGLIKHVEGDAGADKFLPILIYVVLKSNPPKLVSNVQYINRFRNPDQLQSEGGYYLTNLMGAIAFIESLEAKSLSITQEEFDSNIEKTMKELEKERPLEAVKEKVNYDNAIHPSQSPRPGSSQSQQPLIDPVKAAALLEKGSSFAQKTMQKPLNFMGKILQNLNDSSRPSTPDSDDEYQGYQRNTGHDENQRRQQQSPPTQYNSASGWPSENHAAWSQHVEPTRDIQDYNQYRDYLYQQQQQQQHYQQQHYQQQQQQQQQQRPQEQYRNQVYQQQPPTASQWQQYPGAAGQWSTPPHANPIPTNTSPPRPTISQQEFQDNLATLTAIFPNVEQDVILMILQANEGQLSQTIDTLLDISDQSVPERTENVAAPTEDAATEEPSIEQNDAPPPVPAKENKADEDLIEF